MRFLQGSQNPFNCIILETFSGIFANFRDFLWTRISCMGTVHYLWEGGPITNFLVLFLPETRRKMGFAGFSKFFTPKISGPTPRRLAKNKWPPLKISGPPPSARK